MSDVLSELASALRETTASPSKEADSTRARVLRSVRSERSRWLARTRLVVPLAAAFIGGSAWAAATGRLPASIEASLDALRPRAVVVAAATPKAPSAPAPSLEGASEASPPILEAPASSVARVETPPASPKPPLQRTAPRAQPSSSASAVAVSSPPAATPTTSASSEAPPIDPADALYATAHRLHFVQRDPAAALQAWNTYLRAAPAGRFAVEANYNRAICLVRLGRSTEAKAALSIFASGAAGGYRRAEAKALLDALERASP